jgi:hypothetical protein
LNHKHLNQRKFHQQYRLQQYKLDHSIHCLLLQLSNKLRRTYSTPHVVRSWLCINCDTFNCSVTWHCLNCKTVVNCLAPIYKEAFQKKNNVIDQKSDDPNLKTPKKKQQQPSNNKVHNEKTTKSLLHTECVRRYLSMDSGLNTTNNKKIRCQLCLFNRFDLFCNNTSNNSCKNCKQESSKNPLVKRNLSDVIKSQSNRRFTESSKKKFSLDETDENFLGESLRTHSKQRINKSLSSIADPFGFVKCGGSSISSTSTSLSNIRPNSLTVHKTTNAAGKQLLAATEPCVKEVNVNNSGLSLNDAQLDHSRQLSVPNTNSELLDFETYQQKGE